MANEERRKAIIAALARWSEAVDVVLDLAEGGPYFTPSECPLVDEYHRNDSEALFGTGCFEWTCKLCGRVLED